MESRTILIVDDEPQLRNLLRISLELDNYKVLEASNGAEGVDAAATFIPDLISWISDFRTAAAMTS